MSSSPQVGFIGLGVMGHNMAGHLVTAGYPLIVHDMRKDAADQLLARGATWGESVEAVAGKVDVLLTALPGPKEVQAVALGDHGVLANMRPGATYVDLSTNSPEVIRSLYGIGKEVGVDVLDATMSGGMHGAETRRLSLMVGGDRPVFERHRVMLEAMSDNVVYCGSSGAGAVTKIVNNHISLTASILVGEALALGNRWGVDVDVLADVIGKSSGSTWRMVESFPRYLFKGNFDPGFALDLAEKDLRLAKELADGVGADLSFLDLSLSKYREAQARGWGRQHSEAVVKLVEEEVGVELRTARP